MKSDIVLPTTDPTRVLYLPSRRWANCAARIAPALSTDPGVYRLRHTLATATVETLDRWIRGEHGIALMPGRACASAYYLHENEEVTQ